MRVSGLILLGAVIAGALAFPLGAAAQSKIYPAGTDCANLTTIAERLLCGRQEFRRQSGTSVEQPAQDQQQPSPFPQAPSAAVQVTPAPAPVQLAPRSASPNH